MNWDTYITVVLASTAQAPSHPNLAVDHHGPNVGQTLWQRCHGLPASLGPWQERQHRVDIVASASMTTHYKGYLKNMKLIFEFGINNPYWN